jgi:AcrR family transcriptional regulator
VLPVSMNEQDWDTKTEERRTQILDAATAAIIRKGYNGTTMNDIVNESGLSKGAIYWYFKSKKEILLALTDRFIKTDQLRIIESAKSKKTVLERLRLIIESQFQMDRGALIGIFDPEARKLLIEFWQQLTVDSDVHDRFKSAYNFWLEFCQQQIQEAVANGEIRPVDAVSTSIILIAIFDGLSWHKLLNLTGISSNQMVDTLFELLLKGLQPNAPANC